MNNIFKFIYDKNDVTVFMDGAENIWFIGNEIATIFGYKAPQKIISKFITKEDYKLQYGDLKKKWKTRIEDKNGNEIHQMTTMLNEKGLFKLIIKSKIKEAEKFQEWIIEIVLPEIRRNSVYQLSINEKKQLLEIFEKYSNIKKENKILLSKLDATYHNPDLGIIYVKKVEHDEKKYYKIGKTNDPKLREQVYKTGNIKDQDFKVSFLVDNIALCERIVKYKLRKCQYMPNYEIYHCKLSTIKKIIKNTINLLNDSVDDSILEDSSETYT